MIKYLDDFYKELYVMHLCSTNDYMFSAKSYNTFYNNLIFYAKYYDVLYVVRKYNIIIDVFEKVYCQGEPYKNIELVEFITHDRVLEYENKILAVQRKNKMKKLLVK